MQRGDYIDQVIEPLPDNPTLMERLVRWFITKDLYATERLILQQEARRLKIKTDLQEKRINDRTAAKAEFRLVATWTLDHKQRRPRIWGPNWVEVTSIFFLEESFGRRRVTCGPLLKREADGSTTTTGFNAELDSWEQSTKVWRQTVRPWVEGAITKKQLKAAGLEVVGE